MKLIAATLLSILFFLSPPTSTTSTTTATAQFVYDVTGKPVEAFTSYLIDSVPGYGGGLTILGLFSPWGCSRYVGKYYNETVSPAGESIMFIPKTAQVGPISVSTDHYIAFNASNPCPSIDTLIWALENTSDFIFTGGSFESVKSKYFQIKEDPNLGIPYVYMLLYCQTPNTCLEIGSFSWTPKVFYLGVVNPPFPLRALRFRFKKVTMVKGEDHDILSMKHKVKVKVKIKSFFGFSYNTDPYLESEKQKI